jgi:predicted RND superfamily exporter protein
MAGKTDEYGLTVKQRKFAENVIAGMSLSDAYRNAYDAGGMTNAQIHREASLLGSDPRVAQCMEALGEAVRRKSEAVTVSDRDMLVTLLRQWSKGEAPATQTQLRAAELLGKACGLYRDVVEDHRERPAALVAADLERRLSSLLSQRVNADVDETANVAGCGPSPSSDAGCGPAGSGVESLQ